MSLSARGLNAANQSSPSLQLCRKAIMTPPADIPARADDAGRADSALVLCEYTRSGTSKAGTSPL